MMNKSVGLISVFNERTGYGIHATRFAEALERLTTVKKNEIGDVNITLVDSVSIQNVADRLPFPSICYNVWESTEQPQWFMDKLKLFDQLWVPSEWQRACSIAQGVPEEFVKVVPEGVDPEIYKPGDNGINPPDKPFTFVHVGQWQHRKSTLEIIQAFLKAFSANENVILELSVDTLFPSDNLNSTEERLAHHGINDPRIRVVHFEEREAYIRRLQSANCFVSCSRSEGWGLPIIESMACGIPTIVADFGGSTEYAYDAINVRIRELRKPTEIFGGWDVPGKWGEPDFDHLAECMRDAYANYSVHKEKALKTAAMIRSDFSWDAAAKKAIRVIDELVASKDDSCSTSSLVSSNHESDIKAFARKHGYDIISMKKRSAIFIVDCHPTSQDRMDTLIETINQVKRTGHPILVTSHCPLPAPVVELADYYIYDKRDILSPESDMPTYWRKHQDGKVETVKSSIPCHALAATHNVRNAVDFCRDKYDWIYQMTSDVEVDLNEWLGLVYASDKPLIAFHWDNDPNSISGQLIAGRAEIMDKITPKLETWEEFAAFHGENRFCCEKSMHGFVTGIVGADNIEWLSLDLGNRFDQVDRAAWKDDIFSCNFIGGPYLQINGLSNREYDVVYGNSVDGASHCRTKQKVGMWSRPDKKFYRDWTITAYLDGEKKFEHKMDLRGQRVLISLGSKALGDTLAWMPYVEEFRKKHQCHIICSSWWNEILDYPEIEFVEPGSKVENIYANYDVGCFDEQPDKNPTDWRRTPLQKVASDILGLEYTEIRTKIKNVVPNRSSKHVCFSEFSTMQNKMWNHEGGWQKIIDYLNSIGYECWSISKEPSSLNNVIKRNNQPIEQTFNDIAGADFYIGLNHGPSWIAYTVGTPLIMIDGVAEEWNNPDNPYRIKADVGCKPCFNNTDVKIDRSWNWCVNEDKFACTKAITPEMVIDTINRLIKDMGDGHEISKP